MTCNDQRLDQDNYIQNPELIPDSLRAGKRLTRISGRLEITPVSKRLRGPFITSHNIYYVKSNASVQESVRVCNRLNTCVLEDVII